MIIEDFIMLGRTAPTASKKHGLSVCSAGYSKELRQFVRIYPLPFNSKITKWSICRVPLVRNIYDNRQESWRLNNGGTTSECCVDIISKADKNKDFEFLISMASTIEALNEQKKSLGVIKLNNARWHFNKLKVGEENQQDLFWQDLKIPFEYRPRILFDNHDLQLLDWGCREFLRKYPENLHKLWDALLLTRTDYEHLAFVGNMNSHRNNWQIISLLSRKKQAQNQDIFAQVQAS